MAIPIVFKIPKAQTGLNRFCFVELELAQFANHFHGGEVVGDFNGSVLIDPEFSYPGKQ